MEAKDDVLKRSSVHADLCRRFRGTFTKERKEEKKKKRMDHAGSVNLNKVDAFVSHLRLMRIDILRTRAYLLQLFWPFLRYLRSTRIQNEQFLDVGCVRACVRAPVCVYFPQK